MHNTDNSNIQMKVTQPKCW